MKKKYSMKNKKTYLAVFILILCFSFIFQGENNIINQQNVEDNRNIKIKSSTSISHEYEWYRKWGGVLSDIGGRVAVDSLDNIYIVGETASYGVGGSDMVLVKYNNAGVQQWYRTWGGANYDSGVDVAVDSTNHVYLLGVTQSYTAGGSDIVLVKYDNAGMQQWNRTWGGTEEDEGYGITIDPSNNVYITGYTESFGNILGEEVLVKYGSSGVLQWNKTSSEIGILGRALALDSLGNIYIAGDTGFGAGLTDICLEKYNNAGILQWNKTWGGSNWDYGLGVAVDSADNVYVSGRTRSFGVGDSDIVLLKYDSVGIQQWNRTWGGINTDYGNRIAVDSSDNIYLAATTVGFGAGNYDMTLVKYNFLGEQQWYYTWGDANNEFGIGVALDSLENIYFGGTTDYSFGGVTDDIALVKYSKIPEVKINSPHQNDLFGNVPPSFNISVFEPNLDSTWYTLDGGITNITFSGLTGTINQTEWGDKGTGWITITFWANNTFGKNGYAEVTIFKDIDDPEITIKEPSQGEKFGDEAPNYDISIVDPNLDLEKIWYSLDNGITNFSITQDTGTINQTAWDACSYGTVSIKFWAKDLVGNTGISEVIVEKVKKNEEQEIPFELIIILSTILGGGAVIGIAIVIFIRKRRLT